MTTSKEENTIQICKTLKSSPRHWKRRKLERAERYKSEAKRELERCLRRQRHCEEGSLAVERLHDRVSAFSAAAKEMLVLLMELAERRRRRRQRGLKDRG